MEDINVVSKQVEMLWFWARIYMMIAGFGVGGVCVSIGHGQYGIAFVLYILMVFFPGLFVYRIGIRLRNLKRWLNAEVVKAKERGKELDAEIKQREEQIAIHEARLKELRNRLSEQN